MRICHFWIIGLVIVALLILVFVYYFDVYRCLRINSYDIYKLDYEYERLPRVNCRYKVVVSLTTIPDRIDKIQPTIISILSQTHKVDEIRINIPKVSLKGEPYIIPIWLKEIKNVRIIRNNKDFGPSTKLLPTLKDEDEETRIIVIDDDIIYGSSTIKNLIDAFEYFDGNDAITVLGNDMKSTPSTIKYIYKMITGEYKTVDILRGYCGYVVKPKMFSPKIFDYDSGPKESFNVDDNWISGWLRTNGVKIRKIGMKYRSMPLPNLSVLGTQSLSADVNGDKYNDNVVNMYFKYGDVKEAIY